MHFAHSAEIWGRFPHLVPGILVVEGIHAHVDVEPLLEPWYVVARKRVDQGRQESDLPEIAAWRRAYTEMGLKPTQYRSAAEALLRRFRKEGDLPRLRPLVDLCNAVALAFAVPVAVYDLAGVVDYLEVRHARGDEQYVAFDSQVETPAPGEVIFVDATNHAHARRWTFRQSRRSTVGGDTRQALIVTEALHATGATDVPALIDVLGRNISAVWSVPRWQTILNAKAPRLEFSL